jgi:hypothetical protein
VFAVLFLRRRRSCLEATIWVHNYPSDLPGYWGVVGVMGLLVPRRWCQNDAQQNSPKNRNPTESDRPTLPFLFSLRHPGRLSCAGSKAPRWAGGGSGITSSSHTLLPGAWLLLGMISGKTCVHSMRWPKLGAELWLKRSYSARAGASIQLVQSISSYSRHLWRCRTHGRSE